MRRTIRGKASIRSVSIMRLRTDTSHPLALPFDCCWTTSMSLLIRSGNTATPQMTETVTGFRTLAARRTAPAMFSSKRAHSPMTRDYALSVATADRC